MFNQQENLEVNQEWDGDKFTFDEWDYSSNDHRGVEPVVIVRFIRKNYVNYIYMDNGSSTNVMYKHFCQ